MNNAEWLAEQLKNRENPSPYTPLEGIIEELPNIKIRIDRKGVLDSSQLRFCVNVFETDINGSYTWLGRRVYLLPCAASGRIAINKYLVIGGDIQ